ncbi:MAG: hypothetical protein IPJ19_20900 [Planctomycetes bacterium]|nr:hypothetical protein [Planctomycetota bacterium]
MRAGLQAGMLAALALVAGGCESARVNVAILDAQHPGPCEWELAEEPAFTLTDALALLGKHFPGRRLVTAGLYREGANPRCLMVLQKGNSVELQKLDARNGRFLSTQIGTATKPDAAPLTEPALAPARALALALESAPQAFARTIAYQLEEGEFGYTIELVLHGLPHRVRVHADGRVELGKRD